MSESVTNETNEGGICTSKGCSLSNSGPPLELLNQETGIQCRSVQELSLLFTISRTLANSLELGEVVQPALRKLQGLMGLERGTITIINRDTGSFVLAEAVGLPRDYNSKNYLKIIKKVLSRTVDKKEAVIIPDLLTWFEEESFSKELTQPLDIVKQTGLISVPLKLGEEIIGTLSIERLKKAHESWESDLRILSMIASIIAQAARLRQDTHEHISSLRAENDRLQEEISKIFRPEHIIGNSSLMKTVYLHIEQVAQSVTTVLIRGESGTGKELIAKALHQKSDRTNKAFVKFNCAALPESIIESELFGHEKGAFTGALSMRRGRFETAHGGTIFLDEIGDISPAMQVKLLRVLQEKEFERVGSQETITSDVRILAATSRDLESMMAEGKFREDLYYRLNVFPIYAPPLRERKSDVLLLADHFIEKYSGAKKGKPIRISSAAIDLLMSYHWPGNVRELENCIERAVLLSKGQSIKAHHLPPTLQKKTVNETRQTSTLEDAIDSLEREMIVDALKETGSNMAEAARNLGITERKINLRVKKHQIDRSLYR